MVAIDLDQFYRPPLPCNPPTLDKLPSAPPEVTTTGTALGAELLALDDSPLDWLLDVTEEE